MHGVVNGVVRRMSLFAKPVPAFCRTCARNWRASLRVLPPKGEANMALASLNLAASNLSALAAKLAPVRLSTFIPAKLAVIPVVAGLAVGTAAGASFVTSGPASEPAAPVQLAAVAPPVARQAALPAEPATAPAARPCETQTWPYLDAKCMAGPTQEKRVRLVTAPRAGEAANAATKAPDGLVTGDTVLRAPQNIDAIPLAETKPTPRGKRKDARKRDRPVAKQAYQVPSESGQYTRPVIVVRPMRLDSFR
jgi:hypothetical protein